MTAEYYDQLTTLGLSSYEARAYAALVKHGVLTADEVASEADVPLGRVYDVLNSLVDRAVVRADDGRPRTYTHVDPAIAIDRLLERRQSELETKRSEYERTASSVRQALTEVSDQEHNEQFATSAFHDKAARDLLLERFSSASSSIQILVDDVAIQADIREAFVDELCDRAAAGIRVQLLGTEFEHVTTSLERLRGAGVRIRGTDIDPHQRFIVIDDREVCVEVLDPISAEELLALVNFRDETIAEELASEFNELWRRAGPGF